MARYRVELTAAIASRSSEDCGNILDRLLISQRISPRERDRVIKLAIQEAIDIENVGLVSLFWDSVVLTRREHNRFIQQALGRDATELAVFLGWVPPPKPVGDCPICLTPIGGQYYTCDHKHHICKPCFCQWGEYNPTKRTLCPNCRSKRTRLTRTAPF